MLSIKDVAQKTGFSTSTVSRAINNREAVKPETRRQILAAVEQLGYKPNLVAQGLRVGRGNLIALVVPQSATPVFTLIIQHVLKAARDRDYHVVVVNSDEDPDVEEEQINGLLRRNINGIIFSRVSDESRILPRIIRDVPIVVIDRAFEQERVASVVLDNHRAGYLAGRHLIDLGHRRIGCVSGPRKITLCRDRLEGFRDALTESGIDLNEPTRVVEGDFSYGSGCTAVDALLRFPPPLTALWAMNDLMAFGALHSLRHAGLAVPADVSVLGMDDTPHCEFVTPALTTVHYPFKQLAEGAVAVLLEEIVGKRITHETITLEPGLTVRESTEPIGVGSHEKQKGANDEREEHR
jgi:LacI family transcriptional regulator